MINKKIYSYDLLRSPVMTEKSNMETEKNKKYTFYVATEATKKFVALAVEKIFNVEVKSVNIINYKGDERKFRGNIGFTASRKKAIVTLKNNSEIDYSLINITH